MVSYVIYVEHAFGTSPDEVLLKIEAALTEIAKATHHVTDRWIRCLAIFNSRLDGNRVADFRAPRGQRRFNGLGARDVDFTPLQNFASHIPWHVSVDYIFVTRCPSYRHIVGEDQYLLPDSLGAEASKELLIKSAHMSFDQISAEALHALDEITEVRAAY